MGFSDNAETLYPHIDDATHRVMRRFWKFVEREDVEQECVLWCLTHPGKVDEYLREERTYSLVKAMENAGIAYAQKEKAAQSGYKVDDLFYWSTADVEDLLPALFDPDSRTNPPSDKETGGRSNRPPSEGGNWLATLADLSRAYRALDERSKLVLALVYGEDRTRVAVARRLDVSDTTIGKIIDRAVSKMHRELGGAKPRNHQDCECVGTRKVLSNARAQAINKNTYEE